MSVTATNGKFKCERVTTSSLPSTSYNNRTIIRTPINTLAKFVKYFILSLQHICKETKKNYLQPSHNQKRRKNYSRNSSNTTSRYKKIKNPRSKKSSKKERDTPYTYKKLKRIIIPINSEYIDPCFECILNW